MTVRPQHEQAHHRPLFAAFYRGFAAAAERTSLSRLRARTLADARGRLLIVGAGQGHDLDHLPAAVTEVVAVEPDRAMRHRAHHRVRRTSVPVHLVAGTAEHLPLADDSVDTALCALVLCSVDDIDLAAAELRRVLRPGGTLLVLEHVRAADGSRLAAVQDRIDPVWQRIAGGCHTNHRTRDALERAGFDTGAVLDRPVTKTLPFVGPGLQGTARPRT